MLLTLKSFLLLLREFLKILHILVLVSYKPVSFKKACTTSHTYPYDYSELFQCSDDFVVTSKTFLFWSCVFLLELRL